MLRVMSFSTFRSVVFSTLLCAFVVGCSTDDKRADTPEGAFAIAQEFEKEDRYEEAIRRFQEVKNKFPYSKYATLAEMAIADTYYKQESFPEAQVAYQAFKDLHPKHPQTDYATFKLGMSFYEQVPKTVDRDLTLANSAILYFDEVIKQYPNSEHVAEAKEKKAESLKMLAGKEDYIANFYFIREKYDSALTRYEGLLRKYPNLGFDAVALSRAAISAKMVGEPNRARRYISDLEKKFPDSSELKDAKKEVE